MTITLSRVNAKLAAKPFTIQAKKEDNTKAEIVIYADIGPAWWGDSVSAKSFSDELAKLPNTVSDITVRINSGGGDVFDGITIYNRLKQHKAKVTVIVDGLAASIASIIALAGDEIVMAEGAMMMIHKPWTWTAGNSNDFDEISRRLLEIEDQLVGIYSKRAKGLTRQEIKDLLKAETWMDANQAKEYGFVDKLIEETLPIAASALDKQWMNRPPRKIAASLDKMVRDEADALQARINKVLNGSGN